MHTENTASDNAATILTHTSGAGVGDRAKGGGMRPRARPSGITSRPRASIAGLACMCGSAAAGAGSVGLEFPKVPYGALSSIWDLAADRLSSAAAVSTSIPLESDALERARAPPSAHFCPGEQQGGIGVAPLVPRGDRVPYGHGLVFSVGERKKPSPIWDFFGFPCGVPYGASPYGIQYAYIHCSVSSL